MTMIQHLRFATVILLLTCVAGCMKFSTSTEPPAVINDYIPPPVETPFAFHKPRLGATFTMMAINRSFGTITSDTTFVFTVVDTSAVHNGKSNVLEFDGYYRPFFVSYRPSGDIDISGDPDYIFGRESWTWWSLAVPENVIAQTWRHDSIISNPDPNDTRQIERDTNIVTGKDTLYIQGHYVECIKLTLLSNYTLISVQFGFKNGSTAKMEYWYAPSLGYWAKEHYSDGSTDITFQLTAYSL